MKVQEERLFKIPIDEIRAMLQNQYGVDLNGVDPYLEEEHIVFAVRQNSESSVGESKPTRQLSAERKRGRARRRRRKRNRIKTRGWNVIAKITNSNGLVANIYEPLVKAIEGREVTKSEQRKIVRQLLIANGNDPSEESVDYFTSNTLEYLAQKKMGAPLVHATCSRTEPAADSYKGTGCEANCQAARRDN